MAGGRSGCETLCRPPRHIQKPGRFRGLALPLAPKPSKREATCLFFFLLRHCTTQNRPCEPMSLARSHWNCGNRIGYHRNPVNCTPASPRGCYYDCFSQAPEAIQSHSLRSLAIQSHFRESACSHFLQTRVILRYLLLTR